MSEMSMKLQPKQLQNIKQIQRLIMSPQMQQAIHLLQMPIQELSQMIEMQLQENPVMGLDDDDLDLDNQSAEDEVTEETEEDISPERELVFDEHHFEMLKRLDDDFRDYLSDGNQPNRPSIEDQEKLHMFLENSIHMPPSLFEHLMEQARETFETSEAREIAEALIGNLDASGFLRIPLNEISVLSGFPIRKLSSILKDIQQFDPAGIGACSLQESLLIQLERAQKKDTLAYQIVAMHYDELLHNHIPLIQKALKISLTRINHAVDHDIAKLDLHPGASYSRIEAPPLVPDALIIEEDGKLIVSINNDDMPRIRIHPRYMRMLYDENLSAETKDFIKNKISSAKWLQRNICQRNDTVERIADFLAKKQCDFFIDPNGVLVPLVMKTVAEELGLHESTIARAVANKYISTPRGMFPLKFFFSNAYVGSEGNDISSTTVRNLLKEFIENEDKTHPLSDERLSLKIKAKGIPCARRTVAKYRAELDIGNAQQRRRYTK